MAWYSWLTGGSDTAEKVVDGAVSGLDMLFYTDEEKSIASMKILDWKLAYANATKGQSISRRIIATIVSLLWALLIIAAAIAGYFATGEGSYSNYLLGLLKEVSNPFMIIIGFYFLAHVVGNMGKKE